MLIVVSMKDSQSLTVKKIKSSDVVNHLQPTPPQPTTTTTFIAQPVNPNKVHLDALGIVQIFARIDLSEQEYKQYLDSIPPGSSFSQGFFLVSIEIRYSRFNGICLGTSKERKPQTAFTSASTFDRC